MHICQGQAHCRRSDPRREWSLPHGCSISGSALRLLEGGAPKRVYIPRETRANHPNVVRYMKIAVSTLPYYSPRSGAVAFVAANDPTGCDLSQDQWDCLVLVFRRKGHFAFFGAAYLGFASRNHCRDSAPLRLFVEHCIPMLCATSYGKTFGIYGERIGVLSIPLPTAELAKKTEKHMKLLARAETGAMPVFGSTLIELILGCEKLSKEWKSNLRTMSEELKRRRLHLHTLLKGLGTPGDWSFLTTQTGMVSYTGLSSGLIDKIRETFHVCLQDNGRLSIAGLNAANISHVARSIDTVVRHYPISARKHFGYN